MRLISIFWALLCMLTSCGGQPSTKAQTNSQPKTPVKHYTYRVVASYPHSTDAYTQGLEFHDEVLWEGTGQTGESRLQIVDLTTGREQIINRLPNDEFGEGITILNDKIYQLTWTDNKAYVYDRLTHRIVHQFRYMGEGWGLCNDGEKIYKTDGSDKIFRLDPTTFRREKTIVVTYEGQAVDYLNELEWINDRIWANVYMTNQIVIIDPESGCVEGVIDLEGLLPRDLITDSTDVLNGIAYNRLEKKIYVTGKNWPKIFQIEIVAR